MGKIKSGGGFCYYGLEDKPELFTQYFKFVRAKLLKYWEACLTKSQKACLKLKLMRSRQYKTKKYETESKVVGGY